MKKGRARECVKERDQETLVKEKRLIKRDLLKVRETETKRKTYTQKHRKYSTQAERKEMIMTVWCMNGDNNIIPVVVVLVVVLVVLMAVTVVMDDDDGGCGAASGCNVGSSGKHGYSWRWWWW